MNTSIEHYRERWLTLPQAADLLPRRRRGRKVAASTLYRWAKHGLRGVYLQVWQVGGGLCTTLDALEAFFAALSEAKGLRSSGSKVMPQDKLLDDQLKQRGLLPKKRS